MRLIILQDWKYSIAIIKKNIQTYDIIKQTVVATYALISDSPAPLKLLRVHECAFSQVLGRINNL